IVHVFNIKGYSTLKFNFRGVGKSQGQYDNGVGEQKDVLASLSFLADLGIQKIDLVGYSFGAWVNAHAALSGDICVENMAMVSPPVGFMDFREISAMNALKFVITGSRDDIAPADTIKKILPTWNPDARFEIIHGADHFYGGYLSQLESVLSSCI
ncbi:MAG: alpha/beta hydrolase, partial [Deltaproteobacteria bacterium]|nr:alpha/beta hydrolase [Deltaproteobacteria bacterium]